MSLNTVPTNYHEFEYSKFSLFKLKFMNTGRIHAERCRPCQSQGKAAGHIRERTATKRKRRAATGAAEQGSDSSDGELPASLDLVDHLSNI